MGVIKQEIIVLTSHFAQIDFGIIGLLSWIVVILGVVYFVLWVIAQLIG